MRDLIIGYYIVSCVLLVTKPKIGQPMFMYPLLAISMIILYPAVFIAWAFSSGFEWTFNNIFSIKGILFSATCVFISIYSVNIFTEIAESWRKTVDSKYRNVGIVTSANGVYHKTSHYKDRCTTYKTSEALEMGYRSCDVCCPGGDEMKNEMPLSICMSPVYGFIFMFGLLITIAGSIFIFLGIKPESEQNTVQYPGTSPC